MWTQQIVYEIAKALWYLPPDKLMEAKAFVLSLKERYGYEEPVDESDEWTDEDRQDAQQASLQRLDEEDPVEDDYG
jgi:hypothetical protein